MVLFKKLNKPRKSYKMIIGSEADDAIKRIHERHNEKKRILKERRKRDRNAGRK